MSDSTIDAEELTAEGAERIYRLESSIWINYPKATQILRSLNELMAHPRSHRMPNMALIGDSNNGKSALIQQFVAQHCPEEVQDGESAKLPVLIAQCPGNLSESRLYTELLNRLFTQTSSREAPETKFSKLKRLVSELGIKMIILDEFHHAFGGPQKMRNLLNAIKYMCNELQIPFVLSGTPEMLNVLQQDPQFANRFPPRHLKRWQYDDELKALLATFEDELCLAKPSGLWKMRKAMAILAESDGLLGDMLDLLRMLAVHAIRTGVEEITEEMLGRDYLETLGWTAPSLRGHYRPTL
ncbi:TniB family NTP-binding protein [Chitinimonas sp. JJ19]|uniref:TniB family NTP-binding protein n=1 Tax=Chitinimonas sp. JJ19 TaxID=3109352 RepID=UPI003001F504